MVIAIIGVGLIGGSIGLALKKLKVKSKKLKVIGIGRNAGRLKIAKKLGAVDEITTDMKNGVKDAGVIFVCLPVGMIAETVKKIFPFCRKGAVITDVGSVKEPIVREVEKFLVSRPSSLVPRFIGGHPIAGSEKTSVKFASKNLFKNSAVILTPVKRTDKKSVKIIKNLWEKAGAKVYVLPDSVHDDILSFSSHLPHAAAFSLVNAVRDLRFAGSGFRDTTRIAASSPEMWADIIFHNRTNVRKAIKKFKNELVKIEMAKSSKELVKIFRKAKVKRNRMISKTGRRMETEK